MELNPHDLLEINSAGDLISYTPMPDWVEASIAKAPFVVVRRYRAEKGLAAVGVRGSERSERFAAFLPVDSIISRITPEQLAQEKGWRGHSKNIFHCLEQVSSVMDCFSLEWGPAGGVGFELASGKETVTEKSDIDIVIRYSKKFTTSFAKEIEKQLNRQPIRIDVQVETTEGVFSLSEYASVELKTILMRTIDGPFLKEVHSI
ncbi:malonate decarboxylase holo-ACP synthase [Domibacillus epiphyticus]|uniref:Malonate decarboxylase holo-[acyl-carrier-protein] synthase n=1 Tax=Domibacillus epiphyticus TaxID=1714355 RepID=A0A1V2ABB8_9BACI|nr:malonate decarboxylase holo-ACP synthase [Domibacillus epiphyticus]OMP68293.1 hypothetical protein BTO28_02450 [Domibacillus epiphyticus]